MTKLSVDGRCGGSSQVRDVDSSARRPRVGWRRRSCDQSARLRGRPGAAAAAPKTYDGGQPTNAPNKAGKEITAGRRAEADRHRLLQRDQQGHPDAAKELGNVKATTDGPTEAKIDEQIKFIDNYITKGVNGILFAANDPVAIAPVLKKALSKGIHVVGYDANSPPDAREWFVNQASSTASPRR